MRKPGECPLAFHYSRCADRVPETQVPAYLKGKSQQGNLGKPIGLWIHARIPHRLHLSQLERLPLIWDPIGQALNNGDPRTRHRRHQELRQLWDHGSISLNAWVNIYIQQTAPRQTTEPFRGPAVSDTQTRKRLNPKLTETTSSKKRVNSYQVMTHVCHFQKET